MKFAFLLLICSNTQGCNGTSEGKKVQQNLTWKFVIGMSTGFKFSKGKTIQGAILEIALDTDSQFYPIWRSFLLVSYRPSIMALWIVLLFANLNPIDIPITNFYVRICWTFFPSELALHPWAQRAKNYKYHNNIVNIVNVRKVFYTEGKVFQQ